jgi:predicted MFS family arabinose efflux permease
LTGVFVQRKNRLGFAFTAFLSVAGFMIMPFASPFAINNLHITNEQLPVIYMASGIVSLLVMSVIGRWSDQIDNFKIFIMASLGMVTIVLTYTGLGPTPFVCVLLLNVLLMTFVLGMKIPANALVISVPQPEDRGAYMSINAAIQQVSGGVASAIAVMIITQKAPTSLICIIMN